MFHLRTLILVAISAIGQAVSATAYGATVATGTVVDANGNPVAGVSVYLYDENNAAASKHSTLSLRCKAALTVFGVGLSLQSGASKYVKLHWRFGNKYPAYYLCGNDNDAMHSRRIYAGA